jgi:hypothetical protein
VRAAAAIWIATVSVAVAQQPPKTPCNFDGFDTNSGLAEIKAATTAYYGCGAGANCLPMSLRPGDPIVVNRAEGHWTCGYLTARKGSAQGWVASGDIRPVLFDPKPSITAWAGVWVQGENRIEIQISKTPGKLDLEGEASWHGIGGNVHSGEISGEATPIGNLLHYSEGEDNACAIDLALFGKYILANDNNRCGGANVRFWGIWKRAHLQDPLK